MHGREQKIIRLCQPVEVVVVEVHILIAAVNILLPADIVRVGFVEIRELRQDCAAVLLVAYLEEAGVNITGKYRLNMRRSGCINTNCLLEESAPWKMMDLQDCT